MVGVGLTEKDVGHCDRRVLSEVAVNTDNTSARREGNKGNETEDIPAEIGLMADAARIGEKWRREAAQERGDPPEGWDEEMWAHSGNGEGGDVAVQDLSQGGIPRPCGVAEKRGEKRGVLFGAPTRLNGWRERRNGNCWKTLTQDTMPPSVTLNAPRWRGRRGVCVA